MSLKGAALLAFIGTLLMTAFLTWSFVSHFLNVLRGVEPLAVPFSLLIYAFGSLTLAISFSFSIDRSPNAHRTTNQAKSSPRHKNAHWYFTKTHRVK
jgi:hypothetical protein